MSAEKSKAVTLRLGQVFANTRKHRRIIALGNGHVIYSTGADNNLECKERTFLRWLARSKAICTAQEREGGGGGTSTSPPLLRLGDDV